MERRQKRATTEIRAEDVDKNGHWVREFVVRGVAWTTLEHWAGENRFRLVAMRGSRRRLYRLGDRPSGLVTFLECRLIDRRLKLTAWVEAGWRGRLFNRVPEVLLLSPVGRGALSYRRKVCRTFNQLLERMGQPPIVGSQGFHFADTDRSTFWVAGLGAIILGGYLYMTVGQWGVDSRLLWHVLPAFGKPMLVLIGVLIAAILYQEFIIGGRNIGAGFKLISAFCVSVGLGALALFFASNTSVDMAHLKVNQYCLSAKADAEACSDSIKGLSLAQRRSMVRRMRLVERALVRRPKAPQN